MSKSRSRSRSRNRSRTKKLALAPAKKGSSRRLRQPSSERSFIKNGKERKEHSFEKNGCPTLLSSHLFLSCNPSCPASLPVLHPLCPASLLSCIPLVLHPSCPSSLLSFIPPVRIPFFRITPVLHHSWVMSCIPPVLHYFTLLLSNLLSIDNKSVAAGKSPPSEKILAPPLSVIKS